MTYLAKINPVGKYQPDKSNLMLTDKLGMRLCYTLPDETSDFVGIKYTENTVYTHWQLTLVPINSEFELTGKSTVKNMECHSINNSSVCYWFWQDVVTKTKTNMVLVEDDELEAVTRFLDVYRGFQSV